MGLLESLKRFPVRTQYAVIALAHHYHVESCGICEWPEGEAPYTHCSEGNALLGERLACAIVLRQTDPQTD